MRLTGWVVSTPLLLLTSCVGTPPPPREIDATILYTGDLHASIEPSPGERGGAARRAGVIEQIRGSEGAPVFLLDGGGFAAGGPFDPAPQGTARDKERTLAMAAAMAATGYDAVAIGDEELASGLLGTLATLLPLTTANPPEDGPRIPGAPGLRTIERDGVRLNVVALTSDEKLHEEVGTPGDPIAAARAALRDAPPADWTIILSHLGEKRSIELAETIGGIDLILNAHRRRGTAPAFMVGEVPVAQFDYLGRSLIRIDLRSEVPPRVRPIPIDEGSASSQIVEERIEATRPRSAPRPAFEIYLSLGCPYCETATESLLQIGGNLLWNFEFQARLQAPHDGRYGPEELFLGCAREELEIASWLELFLAISRGEPLESCVEGLALQSCIGADDALLAVDRERTIRLGIDETPALFVANRLHGGGLDPLTLEWLLCNALPDTNVSCTEAPECLTDLHCAMRGMLGTCIDRGTREARCSRVAAAELTAILVYDSTAVSNMEAPLIEALSGALPGLEPRWIESRRPEGRDWIARLGLRYLPALALESDPGDSLGAAFAREGEHWVLDPEFSGANLDLTRERVPGLLEIFVPPIDRFARGVLIEALEGARFTGAEVDIRVHPLLPLAAADDARLWAACAEWSIVGTRAPEEWLRYLAGEQIEIEGEAIADLARDEPPEKTLKELGRLLDALEVERKRILFLAENREVVDIHNPMELVELVINLEGAR